MSTLAQDVDKAVAVIKSCVTTSQVYIAREYVNLFNIKHPPAREYYVHLLQLSKQQMFDLDNKRTWQHPLSHGTNLTP